MAPKTKQTTNEAKVEDGRLEQPRKKAKFNPAAAASAQKAAPIIPRAAELCTTPLASLLTRPPPSVAKKLDSPSLVISCDIETHDWETLETHTPGALPRPRRQTQPRPTLL